jgi:hypothetical protein
MPSRCLFAAAALAAASFAAAAIACTGEDPDIATNGPDGGGANDSAADGGVPVDAAGDAARVCDRAAPFGQANPLGGVNGSVSVFHPRLTPDEKEIFYQYGSTAIHYATRADRTVSFATGAPIPLADAGVSVQDPAVTGNRLVLYVSLDGRIARMARPTPVAAFSAPVFLDLAKPDGGADSDPHVLSDESALYFSRYVAGDGGEIEIWRSEGDRNGGFAAPVLVPLGPDSFNNAYVSDDELEIYVSHGPSRTMYRATRTSDAGPFPTPTSVDDINTQQALAGNGIRPGWLSPDGCRLYFAAGTGISQIWLAERQPPPK